MIARAGVALLLSAGIAVAQPRALIGTGNAHATATITPVSVSRDRVQLLVTLDVEAGWHVSWRNPGETGLPTRLAWSLPAGVHRVRETWPIPIVTHTSVGDTHTLEGSVPWLVDFIVDSAASVDRLVSVTIRYGVCRDVCIPAQLTVQGALPSPSSPRLPALPAAIRARLISDAGTVTARRIAPTRLCLSGTPALQGAGATRIVADSGLGMDATLHPDAVSRSHGIFMNVPAGAVLRDGAEFLLLQGNSAASVRLDLRRPAAECRTR